MDGLRKCRECNTLSYAGNGVCKNSKCWMNQTFGECASCGRRSRGKVDAAETKWFYCDACWKDFYASREERLVEIMDDDDVVDQKVATLVNILSSARFVMAFTGAGISTGIGIPDFRSGPKTNAPTGAGLWEGGTGALLQTCATAKPGPTHLLLEHLASAGLLQHVVTQNVDGLHRFSPDKLSELHGNIFLERCEACGLEVGSEILACASGTLCPTRKSTRRGLLQRGPMFAWCLARAAL
eukprot:TRINITY_DN19326_c0_g1_i4.p1 TRINITY_DN19326_c0_g1~~TRINITY_DN19326_c0_g1_i4.p1  ORF type:complete len:240 (+),score=45.87 TRINITY_DN19326_c0_g1_i4:77-796(+)